MSSSWLSRILLHLIMSELADGGGKSGSNFMSCDLGPGVAHRGLGMTVGGRHAAIGMSPLCPQGLCSHIDASPHWGTKDRKDSLTPSPPHPRTPAPSHHPPAPPPPPSSAMPM